MISSAVSAVSMFIHPLIFDVYTCRKREVLFQIKRGCVKLGSF